MATTTTPPDTDAPAAAVPTTGLVAGSTGHVDGASRDLADAIKAVALAASTDQARPVLTGVLVSQSADQPDQLTMVATDSYRLHRVDVTVGPDVAGLFASPVLLPARELVAAAKLLAGRNVVGSVTVADATPRERFDSAAADVDSATTYREVADATSRYMSGSRRVRVTFADSWSGAALTVGALEGDFPKWESLMPNVDDCQPASPAFNPDYLAAVCKAGAIVAGKGSPVFRVRGSVGGSELKPSVFTAARDGITFAGLLMPVRVPS
jgi:hypothetical protein